MTASRVLQLGIEAGMLEPDVRTQMRTIVARWHTAHGSAEFPGWDALTASLPTDHDALSTLYGHDADRLCTVLVRDRDTHKTKPTESAPHSRADDQQDHAPTGPKP